MKVVRIALILAALPAVAIYVHTLRPAALSEVQLADSALALGFLLLFAFAMGEAAKMLNLPKITGFLFAGMVAGPYMLHLIDESSAQPLNLVNGIALSLIAFTAGGELKLSVLQTRLKAFIFTALGQFLYTFTAVFLLFAPIIHYTGMLGDSLGVSMAAAVLLAVIATANSPATAVAVITETRSKGPVSETVLGVTVIKDVIVVLMFGFALGMAGWITGGERESGLEMALEFFHEISASLAIGLVTGCVMIIYLRFTDENAGLFVAGAALAIVEVCSYLGMEPLLASIVAGFVVENFSKNGEKLIRGIETSSAPVYVLFFSLAGQGLDLAALYQMWPLATLLILARAAGIYFGTTHGIRSAGELGVTSRFAWTGFIGQAGVSIGFAVMIGFQFPGWGARLATLVLAGIVINQIVGPVLMKRSLTKAGETEGGRKRRKKNVNTDYAMV